MKGSLQIDNVSITETRIVFDFSKYDVKEQSFAGLLSWLRDETDGSVSLDLGRLDTGFITVFYNPTMGGSKTHDRVVDSVKKIIYDHEVFGLEHYLPRYPPMPLWM